jgi:predicted esterase
LRHRFDNRKSLALIRDHGGKVIIFHGDADRIVPLAMGETLAKEFPETVRFFGVKNGDHNQMVGKIKEKLKAAANGEN